MVNSVVRVLNLLLTTGNEGNKSPYQVFTEGTGIPYKAKIPYIKHLRTYYCNAYYFVKPINRVQGEKF